MSPPAPFALLVSLVSLILTGSLLAGSPPAGSATQEDDPHGSLTQLLQGEEAAGPEERRALALAVVQSLDADAELILNATALLDDRDPLIQRMAIDFMARPDLGATVAPERVRALGSVVSNSAATFEAKAAALAALGRLGDEAASKRIASLLEVEPNPDLREAAAEALVAAPAGAPAIAALVRRLVGGGFYGTDAGANGPTRPVLDATTMAVLLPRYGRWLADADGLTTLDLMPLVVGLKAPEAALRRAAGRAFQEALDRFANADERGRAAELLRRLGGLGIAREVVLYETARVALSAEGDARGARRAARSLASASRMQLGGEVRLDVYESQLWVFRGHYLAGLAELAEGRVRAAELSLQSGASALDAALAERRDLREESERLVHVDLLHQRAVLEVARTLAVLVGDRLDGTQRLNLALSRARAAHERHLEAQAVYAEIRGDVTTGWDALLASEMSPYQLLFGRRGFDQGKLANEPRALGRSSLVELQGALGQVLASVAPGELPGFELLQPVGSVEVVGRLVSPLDDPARRLYLERVRSSRLSGIEDEIVEARLLVSRAQDRASGIIPEPEIDTLENLQRRRFAARQAAEEASRSTSDKWLRDLRIPGSAALWHAQDLKEEGRGIEARAIATRLEADITERGISNWWFVLGHERVVRAQLLAGSAYTDEGRGEEAQRVLLRAVERIEDIERDLSGRGATFDDLAGFRAMRSTALVSLAVNANVRLLDKDKALGYYEQAYALRKDEFMHVLMACYRARSGQEAESRSLLRSIRPGPGSWYNLACTHALLGDTTRALDYLEAELTLNHGSVESANRQREWAAEDPDLANLRAEERFKRLIAVR